MNPTPLLWICGAPGVGKSSVAWEAFGRMHRRGVRAGYVDIDQLGMCDPVAANDPQRTVLKARNLGAVVDSFRAAGAERVIVSGVATAQETRTYSRYAPTARTTWMLLRMRDRDLSDRLQAMGWHQGQIDETLRYANEVEASTLPDVTIDVTGCPVAEVATRALELPLGTDKSADEPHPEPWQTIQRDPAPVLWICGPQAVGKSTVGWHVFRCLVAAGVRTLFLDLRQVGFLQPAAADDPENHRIKARNLGALLSVNDAAAAVVTGPVETESELTTYQSQLPAGTRLSLVRLRAREDVLRKHLILRVEGVGWRETGDSLCGTSPSALAGRLSDALAEADRLERNSVGDVCIDIDGSDPAQIARRVLAETPGWSETSRRA